MSAINGGSFWEGFENGAFSGAISGGISGGITGGFVHVKSQLQVSNSSPAGTSFEARVLPYKENGWAYHKYKVIKDVDEVVSSKIAPAFGQPGG